MKITLFAALFALVLGSDGAVHEPRRLQLTRSPSAANGQQSQQPTRNQAANATAPTPLLISTAPPNLPSLVPAPTSASPPTAAGLTAAPSASSSASQTTTFAPTTATTTAPTSNTASAAPGGGGNATTTPSTGGTTSLVTNCGCKQCTAEVLDQVASDAGSNATCRERIEWIMLVDEFSEQSACQRVADEFPTICGLGCDPSEGCLPKTVKDCGCPKCTAEILDRNATDAGGTQTCRARMDFIMTEYDTSEEAACARVTRELGSVCTAECDPRVCNSNETGGAAETTMPSPVTDCGCPDTCSREILDQMADGFTCRARIAWVITQSGLGYNQEQACTVLNKQYPTICTCDPQNCKSATTTPGASDVPSDVPSQAPTVTAAPSISKAPTLGPTVSLAPTLTAGPTTAPTSAQSMLAQQMKDILEGQGAYDGQSSSLLGQSSTLALVIGLVAGLMI